ncbi:MAG: radical SAM protein [Oscillospiraceae bacterium]|nr:radical SAM protein [Oscillospiraceae bacterium]
MIIRDIEVKSIMTRTDLPVSDFAVNPYVGCTHACKYCYASFMKRFTDHPEPWGEFVDVKHWPEINSPGKYAGKEAFFCSVTDPYHPPEKKYGRTRALLEQLLPTGISISISTKSDLILRDLELIKQFPSAHVAWSINTLDEDFRKEMDRAASIERRLEAMRQFYEAGIQTTCFISPIFPGITDVIAIIERVRHQCNLVWLENLNLRGDYRARILDWIHLHHPELDGLYREIYGKGDRGYWTALDEEIRAYTEREGMMYTRDDDQHRSPFGEPPVVCSYFYHEQVRKSAKKNGSPKVTGKTAAPPDTAQHTESGQLSLFELE